MYCRVELSSLFLCRPIMVILDCWIRSMEKRRLTGFKMHSSFWLMGLIEWIFCSMGNNSVWVQSREEILRNDLTIHWALSGSRGGTRNLSCWCYSWSEVFSDSTAGECTVTEYFRPAVAPARQITTASTQRSVNGEIIGMRQKAILLESLCILSVHCKKKKVVTTNKS